jgi:hypothetical protein
MEHSPAYIISRHLINEGLVTSPSSFVDWPIYVGSLPDGNETKNNAVSCNDTESVKDGRSMVSGETLFHSGVQLILRATAYNTGYAKIDDLKDALEDVKRTTVSVSGTDYRLDSITLTTDIVVIGQEEGSKRRELFSLNFIVTLEEI